MSTSQSTEAIIGTFNAVTCKDPSSIEYDGRGFVEINKLESRTGKDVYEVRFADGMWLLASAADIA